MRKQAFTQGQVVHVLSNGVEVQTTVDGETRTRFYPSNDVFVMDGGSLMTASQLSTPLLIGRSVLVALPATSAPAFRESVAGSRQEMRSGTTTHSSRKHKK